MSKKYYLVWKDATCNGVNPEWIFMTGKDFYKFIKKTENKNRNFMTLDDRVCKDADIITIIRTYYRTYSTPTYKFKSRDDLKLNGKLFFENLR